MKLTIRHRPGIEIITMVRVDDLTPPNAVKAKNFRGLYECSCSDGRSRHIFGDEIIISPEVAR